MRILRLPIVISFVVFSSQSVFADRCCNNPTVWTFKNLERSSLKLTCTLERSVAWAGKPITMETDVIKPGAVYKYTWDASLYSEGMGMLPGSWSCRPSDPKLAKGLKPQKFTTDWGENITISWRKERFAVSRRR